MINQKDYIFRKPKDAIYSEPQISRQKLIAFLTSMRQYQKYVDNDLRYMYALGRNVSADLLLASIYCGELDEEE